jgi:hypothetical protein
MKHKSKCNIKREVIVLGYRLDDQRFRSQQGLGIFLFATTSRPVLGPSQPPIQWVPGTLFLGLKQSRHEADHSPPPSAEIKNAWSYTSIPSVPSLHGSQLKHRNNFTLTFYLLDLPYRNTKHFLFIYT